MMQCRKIYPVAPIVLSAKLGSRICMASNKGRCGGSRYNVKEKVDGGEY